MHISNNHFSNFFIVGLLWILTAAQGFAQVGNNNGVANPNVAGKEELTRLAHVSTAIADSVVAGRPYIGMLELHELLKTSLNEAALEELYSSLFIPINLNTATREEILLIPGIGPRMAHEFEEYRPYRSLPQFRREIGKYVDDEELVKLEQYVFVPIELNDATEEQILSIPGLGPKMLHEFLEYRPYRSIEQFRREIGKYVDEQELARLERYVFLSNN